MEKNKNIIHLDRISKNDKANTVKNVSDTLLLLQGEETPEEVKILKQIGLDNHIKKAEVAQNNLNRFTAFEQRYNRNVYSGSQIKKYCLDNGYRVVRVDLFDHEVPMEVGKAIIDFSKENEVERQKNDGIIRISSINMQPTNFFLLTSLQSINGAKVKSATLFYREHYSHDNYEKLHTSDMVVEVFSWGVPGNEPSLFLHYAKATEFLIFFPLIFVIIGLVCLFTSSNSHAVITFLWVLTTISVLLIKKENFFKWN